jgi:superfamily II DNA or RNA helicase
MYRDYKSLVDNGIEVFSVKTDAFTIKTINPTVKASIDFHDKIGGWRVSKYENINLPIDLYKYQYNSEIKIDVPTFERVELKDEWDCDAMCDIFEEKKRVMIRANLPGSGKSYACEHMRNRGHNVLFVCPTNKLVQKYGSSGVTTNRFFSISIANTDETKMEKFDDSAYDTIVFD